MVFRNQFVNPINFGDAVVFEGKMDDVWHRPPWISSLLWLSSFVNILFPETGRNVPARLVISPLKTGDRRSVQRWRRTFRFPRVRRFNATVAYDARRRAVIESMGPAGMLETDWSVQFVAPDQMLIESRGAYLRIAFIRVPLPAVLTPRVRVVQTAVPGVPDTVNVHFSIRHVLLGEIFGYQGSFRGTRRSRHP